MSATIRRGDAGSNLASDQGMMMASTCPSDDALPNVERLEFYRRTSLPAYLRTRGCSVCDYLIDYAFRFFSRWQYGLYADFDWQAYFAEQFGFCPLHLWQLEALSSPVGLSAGQVLLAKRLALEFRKLPPEPESGDTVLRFATGHNECRACRFLSRAESQHIAALAVFLRSKEGKRQYSESQGTCLRYLALLIENSKAPEIIFLLAKAEHSFRTLSEDMQSFAIKVESLRRELCNRDESDAYRRMVVLMAGAEYCCGPLRQKAKL